MIQQVGYEFGALASEYKQSQQAGLPPPRPGADDVLDLME